jgi:membrane protein implicated in regulation of membrane protease activity
MKPDRLPLTMFALMAGLVIVAVIVLATASWVWFAIAFLGFLIAVGIVLTGSVRSAQSGSEADRTSRELQRKANEAVGTPHHTPEAELEALKRE